MIPKYVQLLGRWTKANEDINPLGGYTVSILDSFIDDNNIEYELYSSAFQGKIQSYSIRGVDKDSGEVIPTIQKFNNLPQAQHKFNELKKKLIGK